MSSEESSKINSLDDLKDFCFKDSKGGVSKVFSKKELKSIHKGLRRVEYCADIMFAIGAGFVFGKFIGAGYSLYDSGHAQISLGGDLLAMFTGGILRTMGSYVRYHWDKTLEKNNYPNLNEI